MTMSESKTLKIVSHGGYSDWVRISDDIDRVYPPLKLRMLDVSGYGDGLKLCIGVEWHDKQRTLLEYMVTYSDWLTIKMGELDNWRIRFPGGVLISRIWAAGPTIMRVQYMVKVLQ